jgi:ubiquinone/menaquinone biosynthesis C-methylase UbiE
MIRTFIGNIGYDVQVRNRDFAAALGKVIEDGDIFLDAGCGDLFIASYIDHGKVIGVDIHKPRSSQVQSEFASGSILELPFGDLAFRFTGSLDVIEHLPLDVRELAIRELVRTSKEGVLIGFPFAGRPEKLDRSFYEKLTGESREIPEWLDEHLRQSYPDIEEIEKVVRSAFAERGDDVQISVSFSESITVTQVLRKAAVMSGKVYLIANTLFGMTLPLHPRSRSEKNSYRAILFAQVRES